MHPCEMNRREMLRRAALGGAAAAVMAAARPAWAAEKPAWPLRVGSYMVDLPEAKLAGLDGVEVRAGRKPADRLEIADPATIALYRQQMRETGLPISSVTVGVLNSCPLASDPRAPAWLEQSIDGARQLGAKVILVAFFGQGNLLDDANQVKQADVDAVVERLKAAAPRAADAGVTLAIENTLSAAQNLEILGRVGHRAVRVYYDVGNSTNRGYDCPAEIRLLKDKIVQFHFKDNPHYMGEGAVPFPAIADAIREINYRGWIVLETTSPSKDKVADARRNAAFVRTLFGMG